MDIPQNQKTIAALILSYLIKNPDAMDTIEGITRWWLLRERIDQSLETVTKSLEFLQQQDFIKVLEISDNELFRLNNIKRQEILNFLENLQLNNGE